MMTPSRFKYSIRDINSGKEVLSEPFSSSFHCIDDVMKKGGKEVEDEVKKLIPPLEDGYYEAIAIREETGDETPIMEFEIKNGSFYPKWSKIP